MKPILLFLFLSAACGVKGQSERIKIDTTGEFVIGLSPKAILTIPAKSLDTARVLFVYCDTTYLSEKSSSMFGLTGYTINNTFTNFMPFVFCQFGYVVSQKRFIGMIPMQEPYYQSVHITYLDEKKKPLHKSVVVFMSLKAE